MDKKKLNILKKDRMEKQRKNMVNKGKEKKTRISPKILVITITITRLN